MKVESNPANGDIYTIASKLHGGNMNRSYWLVYLNDSGTNKILFSVSDASATTNHKYFTQTLTPGTWYHIATVYTAASSNFEVFVNGSSIGAQTGTLTAIGNSSVNFTVGMSYDNPGLSTYNFFDGMIDELRLWNVSRSSSEIDTNKDRELAGNESGLTAYYQLDNSHADSTVSANTLTAVNSPQFSTNVPQFIATSTPTYIYAGTSYANPHAPTSVSGVTQIYDNNGNLATSSPWNYYWDYRNRMTQVATGTATTTYGYDYMNQRVRQTVGSNTTIYPSKYFSIVGATSTSYIYMESTLLATVEADGRSTTTRYIHPDHLNSTNVVTNASGTVVQVLDYYPYGGQRIASSTGGVDSKKKYIGVDYDASSDLNYMAARYQSPTRGQFLSQDPIFLGQRQNLLNPQSLNSYSYGNGNPITNKDPLGLWAASYSLLSGSAEAGFGGGGAGSFNFGVTFVSGRDGGLALTGSYGGNVSVGGQSVGYPSGSSISGIPNNGPFVLGTFAGAGHALAPLPGWQVSGSYSKTINSLSDLSGPSNSINASFEKLAFQMQTDAEGNNTYGLSFKGLAKGGSVSTYPVQNSSYTIFRNQTVINGAVSVYSSASAAYQSAISGLQAQINSLRAQVAQLIQARDSKSK